MIKIEDLTIKIANKAILKNINCQIKSGKITAILGSNGAGKSTLLQSLTGILKPNLGNIFLENKNLNDFSLIELAKKRAVLSQSLNINFPFSVKEIVMMGLENSNYNKITQEKIIDEALDLFEARNLKDRIFNSLSGGEQQRVNIARVLAQIWQKTDCYLFLDEPTSALDLKYQHLLLKIISDLKNKINLTSCIVIHDLNLAYRYCDELILLKDSKIFKQGETKEIYNKENISLLFDIDSDLVLV